jgi:hypothetical protein
MENDNGYNRNMEPILQFETMTDAYQCMREWQELLFLQDWLIKLEFRDGKDMPSEDSTGYITTFPTTKVCTIVICNKPIGRSDSMLKHCEEYTMVHELLHCKPWSTQYVNDGSTLQALYFNEVEHVMLEQYAKSLIMAKYGIPHSWFLNK